MLFGVGLLSVLQDATESTTRGRIGACFGVSHRGLAALVSDLVGEVAGVALAISSFALLLGLLVLARRGRWPAPLAWWIGVAMVPSLVVGGILSKLDERLLEVPLTCLGLAWIVVGWATLRARAIPNTS